MIRLSAIWWTIHKTFPHWKQQKLGKNRVLSGTAYSEEINHINPAFILLPITQFSICLKQLLLFKHKDQHPNHLQPIQNSQIMWTAVTQDFSNWLLLGKLFNNQASERINSAMDFLGFSTLTMVGGPHHYFASIEYAQEHTQHTPVTAHCKGNSLLVDK